MNFSRFKTLSIIFICLLGLVFSIPNFVKDTNKLPNFLQKKVNLGLELQGGSYLQMYVDLDTAYQNLLQKLNVRRYLKKNNIKFTEYKIKNKSIEFKLKNSQDYEKLKNIIGDLDKGLRIDLSSKDLYEISYDVFNQKERNARIINQCIEVVRRRIDETGTKEPFIYRQGVDRIVLQLPGMDDPSQAKKLIGQTGRLTFRLVHGTASSDTILTPNQEILPIKGEDKVALIVDKEVLLTGDELEVVRVTSHEGKNGVQFELNTYGTQRFKEITTMYQGKQLAIVVDNVVMSAPSIPDPIPYGQAVISGKMTIQEATQLRLVLASGSLPAPLKVIEERVVGPSLGIDSIQEGKAAVLWSFAFVAIFMILIYRLFGIFASISLVFNLLLLLASLTLFGATLTLPGIAGIALTIGMAVDANVLIYERIKEELSSGLKPLRAIAVGFDRAFTTILDSNLTTLIGALILYEFGSGPVRGFAVTLGIGIIVSMFTALSLTSLQIYFWSRNRKIKKLPIGSSHAKV